MTAHLRSARIIPQTPAPGADDASESATAGMHAAAADFDSIRTLLVEVAAGF